MSGPGTSSDDGDPRQAADNPAQEQDDRLKEAERRNPSGTGLQVPPRQQRQVAQDTWPPRRDEVADEFNDQELERLRK